MQILSTARCLRRIEKNCILAAPFTFFPVPPPRSSCLSSERTSNPLPRAVPFFFRSLSLRSFQPHSLASFSRGNHPGDRAETHRNYCPTKLINYAGMDRGARGRESFFSVALAVSGFYLACFFFFKPPSFVVKLTGDALSFYLAISLLPLPALSTSCLQMRPGPFNYLSSSIRSHRAPRASSSR